MSPSGTSKTDYYKNFRYFLDQKNQDSPFFFWFGATEPHRVYREGIGKERGIDPNKINVPEFMPDNELVRSDMADYLFEIQWFDQHLGRMIDMLEDRGMLENTIIIVTSDNGMPFPRAKANLYDYGIHVPLAIMWQGKIFDSSTFDQPVGLIDIMPALLESAEIDLEEIEAKSGYQLSGKSIWKKLEEKEAEPVYSGRERHSSARWNNLPYSSRAMRDGDYLIVYNYFPERWPAGAPRRVDAQGLMDGYDDIDNCPTLAHLLETEQQKYIELFGGKRPKIELFDVKKDPSCINNLADDPKFMDIRNSMEKNLVDYLKKTNDPRLENDPSFDEYPRLRGQIRTFPKPDWAE